MREWAKKQVVDVFNIAAADWSSNYSEEVIGYLNGRYSIQISGLDDATLKIQGNLDPIVGFDDAEDLSWTADVFTNFEIRGNCQLVLTGVTTAGPPSVSIARIRS